MTADPAIEARGLSFGYGRKVVGAGVDLTARAGEVLCLLGPNGCGKTTLFKTLIGLLPPLAGEARLHGRPLADLSRRAIARAAAYVPQSQASAFSYSVLEMALMGRAAHRPAFARPTRADVAIAEDALRRLGLDALATRDFTRLSGGQRQLTMIARALAQQADMIVMDEPTASLDFGNQARVIGEVARLAAQGVGIVLSTHDPGHAFAVATRVALMRDGAIVALGAPRDVLTEETLAGVYGVPVSVEDVSGGRRVCVPDYALTRPSDPSRISW